MMKLNQTYVDEMMAEGEKAFNNKTIKVVPVSEWIDNRQNVSVPNKNGLGMAVVNQCGDLYIGDWLTFTLTPSMDIIRLEDGNGVTVSCFRYGKYYKVFADQTVIGLDNFNYVFKQQLELEHGIKPISNHTIH